MSAYRDPAPANTAVELAELRAFERAVGRGRHTMGVVGLAMGRRAARPA